jgi:hypothetical protein
VVSHRWGEGRLAATIRLIPTSILGSSNVKRSSWRRIKRQTPEKMKRNENNEPIHRQARQIQRAVKRLLQRGKDRKSSVILQTKSSRSDGRDTTRRTMSGKRQMRSPMTIDIQRARARALDIIQQREERERERARECTFACMHSNGQKHQKSYIA